MLNTKQCDQDRLLMLFEDRLNPRQRAAAEEHLASCMSCQKQLEGLAGGAEWAGQVKEFLQSSNLADTCDDSALIDWNVRLDFLGPTDWPNSLGRLGNYEVTGVIGRGGFGLVLKAHDPVLQRPVAIKVLAGSLAACGAARKRFAREARATAAVVHEHVVPVHAIVEDRDPPYLVMAYVPGCSLQDRIDKSGPMDISNILRIASQAAEGLAAAHAQGLVHRDVKPANILLENNVERVQISDFGLARAADDASMTNSGVVAGTPPFMSPEQAKGDGVDHRSDIFSLGSTMYAMCTGHAPFRAENAMAVLRKVTEAQPQPIHKINPKTPEWLEAIIGKLLSKDPSKRFQSARDVADLLRRCLAHVERPESIPLPSIPGYTPTIRKRIQWSAMAAVFVGLMFLMPWNVLLRTKRPTEANDPKGIVPTTSSASTGKANHTTIVRTTIISDAEWRGTADLQHIGRVWWLVDGLSNDMNAIDDLPQTAEREARQLWSLDARAQEIDRTWKHTSELPATEPSTIAQIQSRIDALWRDIRQHQ